MAGTETTVPDTFPDYPRGITFEQVWAAIMADRKDIEESRKRQDEERKRYQEDRKQADREWQKTLRSIEELSRQMGGLHRSFGELAEHLVAPGIASRFNEIGYCFDGMAPQGFRIYDEDRKKVLTEIDLLLENGDCLMAVEIKSKPAEKDIAHHIGRLEILRNYRQKHQEKPKRILGAIAGAVFPENLKEQTANAGLYVIEQSGDTMKINVPKGFRPREW